MAERILGAFQGFLSAWVDGCRRRAWPVVIGGLLLTFLSVWYVAGHLGMDTDTGKMISAEVPWRRAEMDYRNAFPENLNLAIVIDGPDEGATMDAAAALMAKLKERPDLFKVLHRPDDMTFFRRNGLLFLEVAELRALTDRLLEMQPLIGELAADPTLRGLFRTLNLALEGIQMGRGRLEAMERPFGGVADAVEAVAAGTPRPVAWQSLLTGRSGDAKRRFILAEPIRDFRALQPGIKARAAVREAASALGLTPENGFRVRQTGSVALNDEEFGTVSEGAGIATIASFLMVCGILYFALRSFRLIVAIQATLIAGLAATAAFAALSVGRLNMISVAFAVLFVGIGVDFGIQFAIRYRHERHQSGDLPIALRQAAANIGTSLGLATATLLAGFLSFVPTDYKGVSELGLIASGGMVIAFVLNLTLLPALLTILRLPGEVEPVGYAWAAPLDRFLVKRRRGVAATALLLAVAGAAALPLLRFDFNPLNLKDPRTESVSTLFELMDDPLTSPNSVDVLVPDAGAASRLAERLKALPEVDKVITLGDFVPKDQEEKLAILGEVALIVLPSLTPPGVLARPDDAEVLALIKACAEKLEQAAAGRAVDHPARRLARALGAVVDRGREALPALEKSLIGGLAGRLDGLRLIFDAEPVTLDDLPAELVRDWVAVDGRHRVTAYPSGDGRSNEVLRRFVAAVRTVAPTATGTPVSIQESSATVVDAFVTAGLLAFGVITLLLRLSLRHWLDVGLVLGPLGVAALLTVLVSVAVGLPVNFANIITLPLLLGIGVAFDIYFVVNWRKGESQPLQSSTARAVLFSALTTVCAFSSLALSSHPGTADMGILLTLSLFLALASALLVLPALLALVRPPVDPS